MEIKELIHFIGLLEKLKCNTRHSWTTSGRKESVAEHSFMLTVMAYMVKDAFPETDINKVIVMCLLHDFGEAVTGDIPAFEKTKGDEDTEEKAIDGLLKELPDKQKAEMRALFQEMKEMKTPEAKLCKGLDKMEAVLQHNEADISTWLPLEYDLQLNYGEKEVAFSPYLVALREQLNEDSREKIVKEKGVME
ncbi:putative hydrolase of HD superfamily [Kineothrix alysoides]|uniref:5'-deoxynucleotidase n=1 Tax=Kineothrix alysoides TaxID=1469948 RepID=A0A4R1R567_9FIRM|nr:HD domain-containing protein [Kineothrix alysoides]TCL60676.1 putative hydrolase of HD superfamily [Kineothrix alysoides]